jgi:hypothetical protein
MYERVVIVGLSVAAVYISSGIAFALAFVCLGVQRVDGEAAGASWAFRLFIIPGVTAFWPMLLRRWIFANGEAPLQKDPHR